MFVKYEYVIINITQYHNLPHTMTTESVKTINVLVRVRPPQEDVESITNINN